MIAFAHYSAPNDISGVTTWLESLILDLLEHKIPVSVLLHHFGRDINESALRDKLLSSGAVVKSIVKQRFTHESTKTTLKFLEEVQPSIFLPQCLPENYYAAVLASKQQLPWIFTHHSDDRFHWALLRVMNPESCAGRVVAVSSAIADRCKIDGLVRKPITIPYGVDIIKRRSDHNPNRFRLVYCGRVSEEQKRISLVIETMIIACQANPSIEALVIGVGADLEKCINQVNSHHLSDRIKFAGRLTKDHIFQEYSESHAILFMSDYEGLPLALLEAMSAGIVPVCREISSGIPEVVKHQVSGLITSGFPKDAADAICSLATNQKLWKFCSDNAAELISSHYAKHICNSRWNLLISAEKRRDSDSSVTFRIPKFSLPPLHPELSKTEFRLSNLHTKIAPFIKKRFFN